LSIHVHKCIAPSPPLSTNSLSLCVSLSLPLSLSALQHANIGSTGGLLYLWSLAVQ
jgi:hypothetical protein